MHFLHQQKDFLMSSVLQFYDFCLYTSSVYKPVLRLERLKIFRMFASVHNKCHGIFLSGS